MSSNQLNAFQETLVKQCRTLKRSITLPESNDIRVLEACQHLLVNDCVKEITLITGEKPEDKLKSIFPGLDLGDSRLKLSSRDFPNLKEQAQDKFRQYLTIRGKEFTPDALQSWAESPLNQAATLLDRGDSDAALAGCVYSTADVIRAALQGLGLREGNRTVSGSFAMVKDTGKEIIRYMYGDCGVVIDPTIEQLSDIAFETVATFQQLFPDLEPKVAFLSFSTKGSAKHPMADKMMEAQKLFSQKYPHIKSDGELQFDAAVVPSISERKSPNSPVKGEANCFIFPNLDAGNLVYKVSQRLAGFEAYGPILQGTKKPYSDLSRGANSKDIFISSLIAMLRS